MSYFYPWYNLIISIMVVLPWLLIHYFWSQLFVIWWSSLLENMNYLWCNLPRLSTFEAIWKYDCGYYWYVLVVESEPMVISYTICHVRQIILFLTRIVLTLKYDWRLSFKWMHWIELLFSSLLVSTYFDYSCLREDIWSD